MTNAMRRNNRVRSINHAEEETHAASRTDPGAGGVWARGIGRVD